MDKFRIKKTNDVIGLTICQERIDYTTVSDIKDVLFEFARKQYRKFVLNLQYVERIDSSGIGLFISFWKQYGTHVQLSFCCLQPHIVNVLEMASIPRVFPIFNTEKEAVNHLTSIPAPENVETHK